jgi:hypothetical protein
MDNTPISRNAGSAQGEEQDQKHNEDGDEGAQQQDIRIARSTAFLMDWTSYLCSHVGQCLNIAETAKPQRPLARTA